MKSAKRIKKRAREREKERKEEKTTTEKSARGEKADYQIHNRNSVARSKLDEETIWEEKEIRSHKN